MAGCQKAEKALYSWQQPLIGDSAPDWLREPISLDLPEWEGSLPTFTQVLAELERPEPFTLAGWAARRKTAASIQPTIPPRCSLEGRQQRSEEQSSIAGEANMPDGTDPAVTRPAYTEDCCSQAAGNPVREPAASVAAVRQASAAAYREPDCPPKLAATAFYPAAAEDCCSQAAARCSKQPPAHVAETRQQSAACMSPASPPVLSPRRDNCTTQNAGADRATTCSNVSRGKENSNCSLPSAAMATARPPEYAVGLRQSAGGSAARLGGGDSAACSGSGGPAGVQAGSGGNAADSPRSPHQPDTDANQGRRDQCENSESGFWHTTKRQAGNTAAIARSCAEKTCANGGCVQELASEMEAAPEHESEQSSQYQLRAGRVQQGRVAEAGSLEGSALWRKKRQKKGGVLDLWNRAAQR